MSFTCEIVFATKKQTCVKLLDKDEFENEINRRENEGLRLPVNLIINRDGWFLFFKRPFVCDFKGAEYSIWYSFKHTKKGNYLVEGDFAFFHNNF